MRKVRQVTQALDRMSSVLLNRYRTALEAQRPYMEALAGLLDGLAAETQAATPPASTEPALVLALGSDRGLCGAFHNNLAAEWLRLRSRGATPKLIVVGRALAGALRRAGGAIEAEWGQPPFSAWPEMARRWADELLARHREAAGGVVHVLFTRFVSGLRQTPVACPLLPAAWAAANWTAGSAADMRNAYIEPASEDCQMALETAFARAAIEHALLHSSVSEQAARHAAMSRAVDSADKMVADLAVRHHRLRQEAITTEMTEMVAGMLHA